MVIVIAIVMMIVIMIVTSSNRIKMDREIIRRSCKVCDQ